MKSIFISSTFKDFQEERDIIHNDVIPYINGICKEYGDNVFASDLRTGVSTSDLDIQEASVKVLNVCFDEIDRCRPYMIILLGERYGWIPEASHPSTNSC